MILRYVLSGKPTERFLEFLNMKGHSAVDMESSILDYFDKHTIDISNCRGQSYDNASNMSGRYNGLQARIKEKNPLADYVPCFAHSLNLVGQSAVEKVSGAARFFNLVDYVYTCFSASTHRWSVLLDALDGLPVVKQLSDILWSAHADATKALNRGYDPVSTALRHFVDNHEETPTARQEATGLLAKLNTLETCILLEFWATVMERFNSTSQKLQSSSIDLNEAVLLLKSLESFIANLRGRFDYFEEKASLKCMQSYRKQRHPKRKRQADEGSREAVSLSEKELFRTTVFLTIIDHLSSDLTYRMKAYEGVSLKFGFLTKVAETDSEKLRISAQTLVEIYKNDLSRDFPDELVQFSEYFRQSVSGEDKKDTCVPLAMLNNILDNDLLEVFPNM